MRATNLVRQLPGIVAPLLLTLLAVAVALRLLNALPAYLRDRLAAPTPVPAILNEGLDYRTIEAAEADLGVTVAVPRYFPSYLAWPPATVRGQRQPARVVSLLFRSADGRQSLQIRQIFWPGADLPFPIPEPVWVVERREVGVNGRVGQLLLGRGQGATPVNQLRWRDGAVHFVVTTIFPAEELLRISESIHVE